MTRILKDKVQVEDIEAAAKEGRKPRPAERYRIRVDRDHFEFDIPDATGRAILEQAGRRPPERFLLVQRLKGGGQQQVGLDERVDFTVPGVERFVTLPRDQHDGQAA